uniref:Uncharacterized protein n=1 Tax=Trieres chinensis TaxID=1514140 RepID=A0A7S2E9W8_TRICV|mmetsp:Transcript_14213/g.29247  ORF Transcript_14213/g.29247 Transcript_14213/m.29247 type:complete len:255 (+) Transcript_14213:181-945(+)
MFPLVKKTSMEDDAIDPVSAHYLRCSGAVLLAWVLHWHLCCLGRVEHERTMLKAFVYSQVLAVFPLARSAIWDEDGVFPTSLLWSFILTFVGMTLWHTHLLRQLPPRRASTRPASKYDRISLTIVSIYMAAFPAKCFLFGPTRPLFPPDVEFDVRMVHNAVYFGSQMLGLLLVIIEGLITGKSHPKVMYQLACFMSITCTCVLYKEAHDMFFKRTPMIIASVVSAGLGFFSYANLAISREEKPFGEKIVKAKAA